MTPARCKRHLHSDVMLERRALHQLHGDKGLAVLRVDLVDAVQMWG